MDLFPLIDKGTKEPMHLNFHSSKIAEVYPSNGLQKSSLLFCKLPRVLKLLLKSGEAVGSLGHLREAEGRTGWSVA